jgi:hypothetical protein
MRRTAGAFILWHGQTRESVGEKRIDKFAVESGIVGKTDSSAVLNPRINQAHLFITIFLPEILLF